MLAIAGGLLYLFSRKGWLRGLGQTDAKPDAEKGDKSN
jgi:hypothetical protein